MLFVYIGVYIFILLFVWGFFFVARHHSLKFKKFSTNIVPVTNLLMVFLFVLSVIGGVMIFFLGESTPTITIDREVPVNTNYY